MRILLVITAILGLSYGANANLVLSPGLGYYTSSQEATQPAASATDSEMTETRADMRLGYVLPMGLYVGGMYSYISSETCSPTCTDSSGFLIGPSIGYFSMMGFYTLLTYHIMGEQGDQVKVTGGKGPQVDIGWVFPISSFISIGPQITWRSTEYDKIETTGSPTQDTDYKATSIAPYLSLWFMF